VYLDANTICPEVNRELFLFQLENMPGVLKAEDERYHGYSFHMRVDVRWAELDYTVEFYSARVWKDDAILFRIPSLPFTMVHNSDQMCKDLPTYVKNAIENALHNYNNDKENRQWKYILLQFPAGHTLSSKLVFADAGEDKDLDYQLYKVDTTPANYMGQEKCIEHWVYFTVARSDVAPNKRGKVTKKEKLSKMAAKLAAARKTKGTA
jgi:hypothetical protein